MISELSAKYQIGATHTADNYRREIHESDPLLIFWEMMFGDYGYIWGYI